MGRSEKLRIAVTGRTGQVTSSLQELIARDPSSECVILARPTLDLADVASAETAIASAKPDIVISAAAYTEVDKAESEPELAYRVNALGPAALAAACYAAAVPIVHLSTDYVFSGRKPEGAYDERDDVGPVSVYGSSKLAGELLVAAANPRHVILRTAWVYSAFGRNFLKTMLRLAADRDEVRVVADQWGNPTSAHDIAAGLLLVARSVALKGRDDCFGTYHLGGTGKTNWSGFAREIFAASRAADGPFATVVDIASSEFPSPVKRPPNSRLESRKFTDVFGWAMPAWQDSTKSVVTELLRDRSK